MVDMQDCIQSISMDRQLSSIPQYSVTEAAKKLGISPHTLRYYDDQGLFPFLQRDVAQKRMFSEADLQWAKLMECLKKSGLSIRDMRYYVKLCEEGNETIPDRLKLLEPQKEKLLKQIEEEKRQLKLLQFKIDYYEKKNNFQYLGP